MKIAFHGAARTVTGSKHLLTLKSGKKILLGVTGSIAAYKAVELCRLLVKEGAGVRVIMTPPASDFIIVNFFKCP